MGRDDVIKAREQVISQVFRFLEADRAEPHRHADAEHEYSDELLALAARDLNRATDALPVGERPVGWDTPDVAQAESEGWAVLLDVDGGGTYAYGPIDDHDLACRFRAFVTAEIDPARVVPLTEVGPARPGIVWRSPLVELLNWRESAIDERHEVYGEVANALEQLEAAGRIDRVTAAELSHAAGIITRTTMEERIREAGTGEGR